jgi:hypothetical protein
LRFAASPYYGTVLNQFPKISYFLLSIRLILTSSSHHELYFTNHFFLLHDPRTSHRTDSFGAFAAHWC